MLFRSRLRANAIFVIAVAAVLVVGVVVLARRSATPNSTANTTSEAHATYAALYESAWRKDAGQGNVLLTATLFHPELRQALAADDDRSSLDDQIWNNLKSSQNSVIPIFLTLDSITGPLTDAQITEAASLRVGERELRAESWKPVITSSRLLNAPANTSAQAGVMVFNNATSVPWETLTEVQLTVKNIGGLPTRTFVWSRALWSSELNDEE